MSKRERSNRLELALDRWIPDGDPIEQRKWRELVVKFCETATDDSFREMLDYTRRNPIGGESSGFLFRAYCPDRVKRLS